ncbi:hypothetical protein MnTg02_02540 [bacterium MnTg02]|nr:hypothetical protein MnTg02_02540 [bacterium MnTg02]
MNSREHPPRALAQLSILPREQFVDPVDLVVGNATEDLSEPGLRIDAIEFCCLNERVGNGGGFASIVRAHEQIIFPPEGYAAHATFGCIVVNAQAAIFKIGAQSREADQAIGLPAVTTRTCPSLQRV